MRMQDMNKGRKSKMLRSTGKNGQKRNVSGLFDAIRGGNDAIDARQGGNDTIIGSKGASFMVGIGNNVLFGGDALNDKPWRIAA